MKTCPKCKVSKPIEAFARNNRRKDGRGLYCKECHNKHYNRYTGYSASRQSYRTKLLLANQAALINYLNTHPCADCGETNPIVLEFDHCKGTKEGEIGKMLRSAYSFNLIEREIEKCEVVCANCHRIRTAKRANSYRYRALNT